MSDLVNSVNSVLHDCQHIETSSFYKNHQKIVKIYDSLIKEGITHRRESQLKTIQDQGNTRPFSYNTSR